MQGLAYKTLVSPVPAELKFDQIFDKQRSVYLQKSQFCGIRSIGKLLSTCRHRVADADALAGGLLPRRRRSCNRSRPARDSFKEHRNDMQDPTLLAIAEELGAVPPAICLSWAVQRENKSGGFVAMATRSDWIRSNLESATRDLLSEEQLVRLCGDGTTENPGRPAASAP